MNTPKQCDARRTRVLAHPDLAARLCEPPLRYRDPELWTGFIPPATIPAYDGDKPNTSPIRRQLLEICNAVASRETEGAP